MLTTRCPDCQTTFRIDSATLHKAAGQVRCGQCSAVFSAFDSLTDTLTRPAGDSLESTFSRPLAEDEIDLVLGDDAEPDRELELEPEPVRRVDAEAADPAPDSDPEPAAEPEPERDASAAAGANAHRNAAAEDSASPAQASEALPVPWHPEERTHSESPLWRIAAAIAALALLLQGVHYFRGPLREAPLVGNYLERVYAFAGQPILDNGEPEDFAIVDWVATAQDAESAAPGVLDISAGVRNESGTPLPYPLLSLELTDRWETTIGSRVFSPDEYMGTRMSRNARIRPNTTVTAQLQLVDPGPDAYGFEVDICVPVDAQRMRCKSDAVFE